MKDIESSLMGREKYDILCKEVGTSQRKKEINGVFIKSLDWSKVIGHPKLKVNSRRFLWM